MQFLGLSPLPQARRRLLALLPVSVLAACAGVNLKQKDPMAKVAPFVRKESVWNTSSYLEFIAALPPSAMLQLKKSLDIVPPSATEAALKGMQADVLEISTLLCRKASWFRVCRSPADFDYHAMVSGIAENLGVEAGKLKVATTFDAEHLVMEKVVADMEVNFISKWNKMSPEERQKVLATVDPNGQIKNHAAVIAESGSLVIRTFSTAVKLAGFSAYVVATTSLNAAVSTVGFTLPMVAYTTLTRCMSVITGPVGWIAGGVGTLFSVAMAGRPDVKTTTSFTLMMHALKLDALRAAEG